MPSSPEKVGEAGFTANVDSPDGTVHVDLACRDQAEVLAAAYADGQPLPRIKTLASKDIHGKGSLRVTKASCQVQLIAQSLEPSARVQLRLAALPAEVAKSTGGPLISCDVTANSGQQGCYQFGDRGCREQGHAAQRQALPMLWISKRTS